MRALKVATMLLLLVVVAVGMSLWNPFFCLEAGPSSAFAQTRALPAMRLGQDLPAKEPPFSGMPLQMRWAYSELVCTGLAGAARPTGKVEVLGGYERQQLEADVTLQTCFKGTPPPSKKIKVLGDSFTMGDPGHSGMVYAGPPTGFVSVGRNLLFLRKTESPSMWRVTIPVYECALPLADVPPDYVLDGTDSSVGEALGAEFMALIRQGQVRGEPHSAMPALNQPEAVANNYGGYVFEFYGQARALRAFERLLSDPRPSLRRAVAITLLGHGDQCGLAETMAAAQDASEENWQRGNAVRALEFATSASARGYVEFLAQEPGNSPVHLVALETLQRIHRREQVSP
jgi:hypothetical protein